MYEVFYHLNTNPFRITPDPKFCFSHASYKSAREYLDYALSLGEGFIMVTGRPGTGKTTLAETFLKDLDSTRVSARITARREGQPVNSPASRGSAETAGAGLGNGAGRIRSQRVRGRSARCGHGGARQGSCRPRRNKLQE
jgi:AAA domain